MDENLSNVVKYLNECVMYLNDDRVRIDDKNEFLTANNNEITNDMEYLMKISGNPKSAEEKEIADKCYNSLLAALQRLKEITASSASVEQKWFVAREHIVHALLRSTTGTSTSSSRVPINNVLKRRKHEEDNNRCTDLHHGSIRRHQAGLLRIYVSSRLRCCSLGRRHL